MKKPLPEIIQRALEEVNRYPVVDRFTSGSGLTIKVRQLPCGCHFTGIMHPTKYKLCGQHRVAP